MYYGIVLISVILFGIQFLCSDRYGALCGNGPGAAFFLSFLSSLAGLVCLLVVNGFCLEWTPFAGACALAAGLNSVLYSVCSLKALSRCNLSVYSLFAMLGGMLLPFLSGLLFYQETMTVGKGICVAFIGVALFLGVSGNKKTGGLLFCFGVFFLNGMSGVISKLFESAPYPKTSAAGYSILVAIGTALMSGGVLLAVRKQVRCLKGKAVTFALCGGLLSQVANLLLLIALAALPASTQYPFVTGGVMIVSTMLCLLAGQKPTRRELLSVFISFLGILALVFF